MTRTAPALALAALLAAIAVGPAARGQTGNLPSSDICLECLVFRVGAPIVVRGPFADEIDSPLAVRRLADGSFRAFTSNAVAYAVDTADLFALDGPRKAVLGPDADQGPADCGRWINGLARDRDALLGLIHREQSCAYDLGQTHKSMALARSADDGLSWTEIGTILSGSDRPTPGKGTGLGDCSWVDGHDGHRYAYCLRLSDWQTVVARAPVDDPGPGRWRKFKSGGWTEPGIGGDATALGFFGTASGFFRPIGRLGLIAVDPWFGGLRLAIGSSPTAFADLEDPLVPIDGAEWTRPAPSSLMAYPALLDPRDGSNDLGEDFLISYTYVAPFETFAERYLVLRPVHLALETEPAAPRVGLALVRWRDDATGEIATSTGPLTPRRAWKPAATLAYLMTRAPAAIDSVKLEECRRPGDAGPSVAIDGQCASRGGVRLATAGWAYRDERAGTVPLYRCEMPDGSPFVATALDCDGLGDLVERLGFGLRD